MEATNENARLRAKVAELERKLAAHLETNVELMGHLNDANAKVAELEGKLAVANTPHCGVAILCDGGGKVYGCGKLKGHKGLHETMEERRAGGVSTDARREWLAAHDAQVRRDALEEAIKVCADLCVAAAQAGLKEQLHEAQFKIECWEEEK